MLKKIIDAATMSGVSIDADHFIGALGALEVCLYFDGTRYNCELYRPGAASPFNYIRTPYERDVVQFLEEV